MAGWTNRGKKRIIDYWFRRTGGLPTNFYLALCTSANTPTADTNIMSDLTEIAAGNGYTAGGTVIVPNGSYFPYLAEDDVNDRAVMIAQQMGWTASGGNLPASGNGARWLVLTDDNATPASRDVICYWDLVSDRTVSNGQLLQLVDMTIRATE